MINYFFVLFIYMVLIFSTGRGKFLNPLNSKILFYK